MFEFSSKSKTGVLKAATIAVSLISLQAPNAQAADTIELKPQSAQIDTAPATPTSNGNGTTANPAADPPATGSMLSTETPSGTDQSNPKLHKLEAIKRALRANTNTDDQQADSDDQQATLPVMQFAQPVTQIYINTYTMRTNLPSSSYSMRANLPSSMIVDPMTLMRAMFGTRSRETEKLYAERDTGYGVCGFLMNMPTLSRGYAMILKCFPSMPAAEADLQRGDFITSVNGKSTLDLPPKEVWDWFTGMPGTDVKIEVLRGKEPISVTLKRMDIGRIPDFATRAEFLTLYKHNGMSKFVQK